MPDARDRFRSMVGSSKTALRVGAAFATVLALFASALGVTLHTLRRLEAAETEVTALEQAKHAGHRAAAMVREQYIHQAHSIIAWNRSHLAHYEPIAVATRTATEELRGLMQRDDERALADEVVRIATEVDEEFRRDILPAIDRGDRQRVNELHHRTEHLVTRVVQLNDALNQMLEERAIAARSAEAALRTQARVWLVGCFTLASLVAAVVALAMTRWIARRLARVTQGAGRLADGDLTARIDVEGSDEFATLASAFNHMAASLERHQSERAQAQKLAAIGEIAAGVAHEINNPLGVILGYTKLLRRDASRRADEALGIIEDEARQCQQIVHALLELARPPASQVRPVDVVRITRDAIERLEEAGRLGGMEVIVPDSCDSAWVTGDETNLRQVVANLVLNAIEASRVAREAILISVRQAESEVELTVADQGEGIADDALPRVLDPFFTTKARGIGLGLAICQAIVHAHRGRLSIEANAPHGTRVSVTLPRGRAPGVENAA